ncbi:MAG TPA: hypothetical protein VEC06_21265 [Paucimonas sp.]|nr:hypothetical protein [Paucimonas sp.]
MSIDSPFNFLIEFIVEIFVSLLGGAAIVAVCIARRIHKLRSYDAIRRLNARSSARRRSTALDVH